MDESTMHMGHMGGNVGDSVYPSNGQPQFYGQPMVPQFTRLKLNPEEWSHFMALRSTLQLDHEGNLNGAEGADFLATSGLQRPILHEIWRLADIGNNGFLTVEDFCVACRLVAHAQNSQPVVEEIIGQEPMSLPNFSLMAKGDAPYAIRGGYTDNLTADTSGPLGAQFDPNRAAGRMFETPPGTPPLTNGYFSSTGAWEVTGDPVSSNWLLTDAEKEKYKRVFFANDSDQNGYLEGYEGGKILRRSGLPESELSQIWALSDRDGDGRLTLDEFSVAMHMVTKRRNGLPLPSTLPPELELIFLPPQEFPQTSFVDNVIAPNPSNDILDSQTAATADFSKTDVPSAPTADFENTFALTAPPETEKIEKKKKKKKKDKKEDEEERARVDVFDDGDKGEEKTNREMFDSEWGLTDDLSYKYKPSKSKSDKLPIERERGTDAKAVFDSIVESDKQLNLRLTREIDQYADEINRLSGISGALKSEMIREKAELRRQLDRKRDFENRVSDMRAELDAIKDEKRKVDVERISANRDIEHYQEEIIFLQQQVDDVERDRKLLEETTQQLTRQHKEAETQSTQMEVARKNVLQSIKAERTLLQDQEKEIAKLRNTLERFKREKDNARSRQLAAQERSRQSAQDRSLMLTALETERSRLSDIRSHRLEMADEKATYERELADVTLGYQQRMMQGRSTRQMADIGEHTWASQMGRPKSYLGRDSKGIPVTASAAAAVFHSAPLQHMGPTGQTSKTPTTWTSFGGAGNAGNKVHAPSVGGSLGVETDKRGIDRILTRDYTKNETDAFDDEILTRSGHPENMFGSRTDYHNSLRRTDIRDDETPPSGSSKRYGRKDGNKADRDDAPPGWPSFANGSE
eukprot:GHVO01022371.1.p1 GENE.GHVO01022371.1~~GHVO01022371.1.p1  ORF type:complete len:907 (+),score=194.31 GHVO01022371.1:134-2722(+)